MQKKKTVKKQMCVIDCNSFKMNRVQLTCNKCYNTTGALYFCCNKEQKICYECSRGTTCLCGKKITKPFTTSKIGTSPSDKNQETCKSCKQRLKNMSNSITFSCKHVCCFKCLSKKIQERIKSGAWQRNYLKNQDKKQVQCNCSQGTVFDISNWMQQHCFCCAESFDMNQRVKLKYGLEIMEKCRNRLLHSDGNWGLTSLEINRLSKECRSCSNLIDGFKKKIGLEDSFGSECNQCLDSKTSAIRKYVQNDKREQCPVCRFKHYTKDMIKAEDFYICKDCYNFSLKKQTNHQKQSFQKHQKIYNQSPKVQKQKVELNRAKYKYTNCIICEEKIKNLEDQITVCQKCAQKHKDSILVQQQLQKSLKKHQGLTKQQIKSKDKLIQKKISKIPSEKDSKKIEYPQKFIIKPQDEQVPDFNRNLSAPINKKYQKCAICDRNFLQQASKYVDVQANFCSQCIEQNEKVMIRLKRTQSQQVSNARIRTKKREFIYRPVDEHRRWRKGLNFEQFLNENEKPNVFDHTESHNTGRSQIKTRLNNGYSINSRRQAKINRRVLDSIIQEIPDNDQIEVAVFTQNIVSCTIFRFVLAKDSSLCYTTIQEKQLNLCMYCQMLCEVKKI